MASSRKPLFLPTENSADVSTSVTVVNLEEAPTEVGVEAFDQLGQSVRKRVVKLGPKASVILSPKDYADPAEGRKTTGMVAAFAGGNLLSAAAVRRTKDSQAVLPAFSSVQEPLRTLPVFNPAGILAANSSANVLTGVLAPVSRPEFQVFASVPGRTVRGVRLNGQDLWTKAWLPRTLSVFGRIPGEPVNQIESVELASPSDRSSLIWVADEGESKSEIVVTNVGQQMGEVALRSAISLIEERIRLLPGESKTVEVSDTSTSRIIELVNLDQIPLIGARIKKSIPVAGAYVSK